MERCKTCWNFIEFCTCEKALLDAWAEDLSPATRAAFEGSDGVRLVSMSELTVNSRGEWLYNVLRWFDDDES